MIIDSTRLYSPKEVITANGGVLPMSLSGLYAAIDRNEIPARKIGKRKFISGKFLSELMSTND